LNALDVILAQQTLCGAPENAEVEGHPAHPDPHKLQLKQRESQAEGSERNASLYQRAMSPSKTL